MTGEPPDEKKILPTLYYYNCPLAHTSLVFFFSFFFFSLPQRPLHRPQYPYGNMIMIRTVKGGFIKHQQKLM